jgi:hypothetical protein
MSLIKSAIYCCLPNCTGGPCYTLQLAKISSLHILQALKVDNVTQINLPPLDAFIKLHKFFTAKRCYNSVLKFQFYRYGNIQLTVPWADLVRKIKLKLKMVI